jgi:hypothetical protein
MKRRRRKTENGGEIMEENRKINVGVVLSTTLQILHEIQVLISEKASLMIFPFAKSESL